MMTSRYHQSFACCSKYVVGIGIGLVKEREWGIWSTVLWLFFWFYCQSKWLVLVLTELWYTSFSFEQYTVRYIESSRVWKSWMLVCMTEECKACFVSCFGMHGAKKYKNGSEKFLFYSICIQTTQNHNDQCGHVWEYLLKELCEMWCDGPRAVCFCLSKICSIFQKIFHCDWFVQHWKCFNFLYEDIREISWVQWPGRN